MHFFSVWRMKWSPLSRTLDVSNILLPRTLRAVPDNLLQYNTVFIPWISRTSDISKTSLTQIKTSTPTKKKFPKLLPPISRINIEEGTTSQKRNKNEVLIITLVMMDYCRMM